MLPKAVRCLRKSMLQLHSRNAAAAARQEQDLRYTFIFSRVSEVLTPLQSVLGVLEAQKL
jgi:hypothetical protein